MLHRILRWSTVPAVAASLSGCSIYPLPEDTVGLDSNQIATLIRCHTRDAIRNEITTNTSLLGDGIAYDGLSGTEEARRLRENPVLFHSLDYGRFSQPLRGLFTYYKDATVADDFTIDTTEVNTSGVGLTIFEKFLSGTNSIGLATKNDRTREVSRHFRIFDSFDSLARQLPEQTCASVPGAANYAFPSAGLTRIRSLVHHFTVANQLGNLGGSSNTDYTTAEMTDTITFTTKNTGNLDPVFALSPVTHAYVPTSVSATVDNSREDKHTIIVLLRLPSDRNKLPRFDEAGYLTVAPSERQKAVAAGALDRQRDYNQQNDISKLTSSLTRMSP
ncbi:hypothetical protein P7D22_22120 [Lichenihabitans sp. Uapishka_5]|uniref:hypothetical protein n=1 Tax=Lichenihabitans sp. Uapishka_5 TaxID=3037302 RepID=UPI0029E81AF5|nr:hypothetical protein [Lichenihabitans sp. Uapishka_5]MDX7953855.1 hypothetical protein [Lichenihabitans sp. Uapishka_5]